MKNVMMVMPSTTTRPSAGRVLVVSTTLWLVLSSTIHSFIVPSTRTTRQKGCYVINPTTATIGTPFTRNHAVIVPHTSSLSLPLTATAAGTGDAHDDIDNNKDALPPKQRRAQTPYQQQGRPLNGNRGPINSTDRTKNFTRRKNDIGSNNNNNSNYSNKGDQRMKAKRGNARHNQKNNSRNHRNIGMDEDALFNGEIVEQETALDILSLLACKSGALSTRAGGGALSVVNFCTALQKITNHVINYRDHPGNDRGRILSDPRFALLVCGVAETLLDWMGEKQALNVGNRKRVFDPRSLSDIAWAIAKLKIVPPSSDMAVNTDDAEVLLQAKAAHLRSSIMDIAKQRAIAPPGEKSLPSSSSLSWMRLLSELCGILMDTTSAMITSFEYKDFNEQQLSKMIWALAEAERPPEPVVSFLVNGMISSVTKARKANRTLIPQDWSMVLLSLAKTKFASCHHEQILLFVNNLWDNESGFLERFNEQALSNSVWAAAKMLSQQPEEAQGPASNGALGICRHAARELIRRGGGSYNPQHLSNTIWAMATLGFGIKNDESSGSSLSRQQYIYLPSDDPDGDRALMEQTMAIVVHEMKVRNLRTFSSQGLSNVCWSKARLNQQDDELLDMIGAQLANPHRDVELQHWSMSLWSMAKMGYANKAMYRAVVARIAEVGFDRFKPKDLCMILFALATADIVPEYLHAFDDKLLPDKLRPSVDVAVCDPVTACFALGASELCRRPSEFTPQGIKDVLWSFARVGMRHPVLFQTIAEHLVGKGDDPHLGGRGGLGSFGIQGISNLAYAYARHSQIGEEVLIQYGKQCRLPTGGGVQLVSFLDVGEGLLQKLFAEIVRVDLEMHDELTKLPPQDISNTVWSFGILGLKHSKFLEAVNTNLQFRMKSYLDGNKSPMNQINDQVLSKSLLSLASLNYTPPELLQTVEVYLMELMDYDGKWTVPMVARIFSQQGVANLAWAVAVFGVYPKHLIEMIYVGLTGIGDNTDPSYLQQSFGDDCINQKGILSLLYLQTAMDLDAGTGKASPFRPPDDFPRAWMTSPAFSNPRVGEGNSGSSSDSSMMGDDLLELKTSKTQKGVSKAFSRIGFNHVNEFVLTMEDLAVEYGIQMSPHPTQVLSIDIANVDMKIGVEFDGPAHFITRIDGGGTDTEGRTSVGKFETVGTKLRYNFNWGEHSQEMDGSTASKQRILKQLGWQIMNIPFWDWDAVKGNADTEDKFCQDLLNKVKEQQ